MTQQIAVSLDLRGLAGPEIARSAAVALDDLRPGQLLEVLSDDPSSTEIVAAWSKSTRWDLLESSHFGVLFRFVVRKTRIGA